MKPGKGIIRINSNLLENHEPMSSRMKIMEPLILSEGLYKKFNISIKVNGGGWSSQTDAIRLALARCLTEANKSLTQKFLDYDRHLLIADTRRKESCKPNDSKARSKRQKSYR